MSNEHGVFQLKDEHVEQIWKTIGPPMRRMMSGDSVKNEDDVAPYWLQVVITNQNPFVSPPLPLLKQNVIHQREFGTFQNPAPRRLGADRTHVFDSQSHSRAPKLCRADFFFKSKNTELRCVSFHCQNLRGAGFMIARKTSLQKIEFFLNQSFFY